MRFVVGMCLWAAVFVAGPHRGWAQSAKVPVTASDSLSDLEAAPRVAPGDTTLRGTRIRAGRNEYALTALFDGREQALGTIVDSISIDTVSGRPVIRRVQTVQRGMMVLVDSSVTDQRTLAPRSHRSNQPTRLIKLEFNGRRVKGSLGPVDVPSLPIDTTLGASPFDSANWDLLVRSLPLAPGYVARFPVYDVDNGLYQYAVRVTGSAIVQGEPAHVVIFTVAKGRESVVWVGKTTGRVLRVETVVGTGLLRQELRAQSSELRAQSSELRAKS